MPWCHCAEVAVPNMSDWSEDAAVTRYSDGWRGLKKRLHSDHICSTTGLPSQMGQSRGKALSFNIMKVEKAATMLLVIGICARTDFFCTSSMFMMNWLTRGLASHNLWRLWISSTPVGHSRPVPYFSRRSRIARTVTLAYKGWGCSAP